MTSLPDISEFPKLSLHEWKEWFVRAATLVLSKTPDDGVTIFYQSDIKRDGVWVDKGYLCQKAAEALGQHLLAHKVVCRAPIGTLSGGRPTYSHLVCFSKTIPSEISKPVVDVLADAGEVTWKRGMGDKACRLAVDLVKTYSNSHTIVDPFCGHGSVLAIANEMGMDAIGVDLNLKNTNIAKELNF